MDNGLGTYISCCVQWFWKLTWCCPSIDLGKDNGQTYSLIANINSTNMLTHKVLPIIFHDPLNYHLFKKGLWFTLGHSWHWFYDIIGTQRWSIYGDPLHWNPQLSESILASGLWLAVRERSHNCMFCTKSPLSLTC